MAVATGRAWCLAAEGVPPGGDGAAQLLFDAWHLAVRAVRHAIWNQFRLAVFGLRRVIFAVVIFVVVVIRELDGLSSHTLVFGIEGLSPIGVWMCLVEGRMMGMELVKFPSAANGRGVHSMVIVCVPRFEQGRLGCFTTGEEFVGQDYERDMLVGLDHRRVSFVEAH